MHFLWKRTLYSAATTAALTASAPAQQPVSRIEAVEAAVVRGPRLAVAQADTAVALPQLLVARAIPDPTLAASYTKDPPQYHASLDLPVDFPWLRGVRIGSAEAARPPGPDPHPLPRAAP